MRLFALLTAVLVWGAFSRESTTPSAMAASLGMKPGYRSLEPADLDLAGLEAELAAALEALQGQGSPVLAEQYLKAHDLRVDFLVAVATAGFLPEVLRIKAIELLPKVAEGSEDAREALVKLIAEDPSPEIREAAFRALLALPR